MDDLEARLTKFLSELQGAEAIDALTIPTEKQDRKRADFLLAGRQLIAEIKSIQDDPSHKIEPLLEPERRRGDFPLFYGSMELDKVLKHLPDGPAIKRRVLQRVVRSVESGFRSADDQIADTKQTFGIPHAEGLLILLNGGVEILSPDVLAWQIARMLQARSETDGTARYPNVNCAWVITETHFMPIQGQRALPGLLMQSEQVPLSTSNWNVLNALQPAWAAFNGVPLVKTEGHIADAVSMQRVAPEEHGFIPRHELWRRQYQANPYLRAMLEPALVAHGARLVQELAPHFTRSTSVAVGEAPSKPEEAMGAIDKALEQFAHFVEEVNWRGIDMRLVSEQIRSSKQ